MRKNNEDMHYFSDLGNFGFMFYHVAMYFCVKFFGENENLSCSNVDFPI